jgi:Fe-S-cluster containining protein
VTPPHNPTNDSPFDASVREWKTAAADAEIAGKLAAVYAIVADQISLQSPACWASGRCCSFEKAGHRLYTTGLEAAYCVVRLEEPLTSQAVALARIRGDCPFLKSNLCTVHAIKPLGCRVYFCDRSARSWQEELSERALSMIRDIHTRHNLQYHYGEWRSLLAAFAEDRTESSPPAAH